MATKGGSGEAVQRAVLFADVCDSTAIYESLGDEMALSLINTLFDKLGSITASHEGIVIKTLGDAVVCQFRDADKAFRAACDMQTAASMLGPRSPLGIMTGESYFRGQGLAWLGLLVSAAVSASLLYAASKNLARQDF